MYYTALATTAESWPNSLRASRATRPAMRYHHVTDGNATHNVKSKETQMNSHLFALWPIVPFGGEGEEGDQGSKGDGSQADSGGGTGTLGGAVTTTQGNQSDSKAKGSEGDEDEDDDDEYEGYSAKELKRLLKDTSKGKTQAEKEAKALQDKQTAEERKKNDENTNLKNDLAAERETTAKLRATVVKQAIEGAIRDDQRFEWFDATMVAQQLDPDVVKVNDEGKVEGLKGQLTKVAKEHPFLLKKDNTGSQQGRQQQDGGTGSGPTGFQPGQGGASTSGEIDRKKLAEEYPALASRI